MNCRPTTRDWTSACVLLFGSICLAAGAYASCCSHKSDWTAGSQVCGGTSPTTVCEVSSIGCNTGLDLACRHNQQNLRERLCRTITPSSGSSWALLPCDMNPGSGWIWIAKNPDGSCCWYYGNPADISTVPVEDEFVANCHDYCAES